MPPQLYSPLLQQCITIATKGDGDLIASSKSLLSRNNNGLGYGILTSFIETVSRADFISD